MGLALAWGEEGRVVQAGLWVAVGVGVQWAQGWRKPLTRKRSARRCSTVWRCWDTGSARDWQSGMLPLVHTYTHIHLPIPIPPHPSSIHLPSPPFHPSLPFPRKTGGEEKRQRPNTQREWNKNPVSPATVREC